MHSLFARARERLAFARLASRYLRSLAIVRVRRRVLGPRRPAWSERYEALVEMLRRDTNALRPLSSAQIRARMRPIASKWNARVDVTPASDAPAPSSWITPRGEPANRGPVLLYFHGGGYVCGSVQSHLAFLARVATKARARVLAVDYRLAPEHPFPAALDDAVAVYRWLVAGRASPSNVVVGGDSAGGGLTLATLCALRDARAPLPAGAVLLSPWADLAGASPSIVENARFDWIDEPFLHRCAREYLGAGSVGRDDPRASPVHADLRDLPPLLVQVGDAEILLDDARAVARRARAAGVDVTLEIAPDMVHVWQLFADLVPEARAAIDRIVEFVTARVGSEARAAAVTA